MERNITNGWISVKDGFPSNNQKILFILGDGDIRMGSFMLNDQWGRKNMFCDGAFFADNKVTYWRPLPAPPIRKTVK